MRYLIKIPFPGPEKSQAITDPQLAGKLQSIFRQIGALAAYTRMEDGRRVDYVLVDLEPAQITPAAEPIHRLLRIKPEFLPEVVPAPYYGRKGY